MGVSGCGFGFLGFVLLLVGFGCCSFVFALGVCWGLLGGYGVLDLIAFGFCFVCIRVVLLCSRV